MNELTNQEYINAQNQIGLLAGIVREIPLDDFLAMIDRAETIGPIVDPTLYIKAGKNLAKVKRLASALREFRTVANAIWNEERPTQPHPVATLDSAVEAKGGYPVLGTTPAKYEGIAKAMREEKR